MIKTIGVVVGLVLASMFFAGCKPKSEGELTQEEIDAATAAMEKAFTEMGEMIDDGNAIEEDSVAEGAGEEVSATPGSEKQVPSNRSKAEDQMQLIIKGLMRYEKEYGEFPKPVDNSGEGTNGAKALYQALSGDGDTQLVVGGGAGGTPSTGIVGSTAEALVEGIDAKANKHGLVSADYAMVDPLGQFWRYRVYDADDQTNNKTFDLWSIGEDGKEDDEAKWIKNW